MSDTTLTIPQYAAFLRGHGFMDTEIQEEIIATLKAGSAEPVRLRGRLVTVQVFTRTSNGIQTNYLAVTLDTSSGMQMLLVAVSTEAGQALVRKLWHAIPSEETEILVWTFADDGRDTASACYPQYATVRQGGVDLRGTNTADLWPTVELAQAPFVAAGVTDKVALRVVEDRAMLDWHMALLNMTIAKFQAHFGSVKSIPVNPQRYALAADSLLDDDPFGLNIDELPAQTGSDAQAHASHTELQNCKSDP